MAALSPQAPTRPVDPTKPLRRKALTNFFDRNWLPGSGCTIVPAGSRNATALFKALTARVVFIGGVDPVAHDPARVQVLDRAQVERAFAGGGLGLGGAKRRSRSATVRWAAWR